MCETNLYRTGIIFSNTNFLQQLKRWEANKTGTNFDDKVIQIDGAPKCGYKAMHNTLREYGRNDWWGKGEEKKKACTIRNVIDYLN